MLMSLFLTNYKLQLLFSGKFYMRGKTITWNTAQKSRLQTKPKIIGTDRYFSDIGTSICCGSHVEERVDMSVAASESTSSSTVSANLKSLQLWLKFDSAHARVLEPKQFQDLIAYVWG